jgi:hypothetical protein
MSSGSRWAGRAAAPPPPGGADEHLGAAGRVAGQTGEVQQGDEVVRGRRGGGEVGVAGERGDLGGIVEHDRPGVLVEPLRPVVPGFSHCRADFAQVVHDVAAADDHVDVPVRGDDENRARPRDLLPEDPPCAGIAVALQRVQRAAVPDERPGISS